LAIELTQSPCERVATGEKQSVTESKIAVIGAALGCIAALPFIVQAQAGGGPTDPQIVGIVVTANKIDIDYAKLALSRSKNREVRGFAQQMVTDHSALQKSVGDLGAKLNVTPEDSDTSKSLKSQSEQTTEKLKELCGAAFDKAYIDNEVGYHQAVINAVSSVLIPNAQNAELKSALEGAAPLFQGHLQHAQRVQAGLENKK
jgi:putative membrane protein